MVNILIARTQTGELINLASASARRRIAILKEQHRFYCPGCGSALILKAGDVKIAHFAHRSLTGCDSFSEPETPLHIKGKLLLHQFFLEKHHHPELEKYLPSIKQRADVLVSGRYAVEFQCSPISPADIVARTEGYASAAIKAVWIRGLSEAPQEGIRLMNCRPFEAAMLQRTAGIGYLLAFHPESNRFFYRSSLFYIGGRRWLGKTKSLRAEKQVFPFAVPKKLTLSEFKEVFSIAMAERDRFVRAQQFAGNRFRNPFWVCCYELGFDHARLPDYVGVPFNGAEIFKTESVVWQLQALAMKAKGGSGNFIRMPGNPADANAASIVREYLDFARAIESRVHSQEETKQLLYAIYCKNV